jgi:DNA-directed RNA polymerase
MLDPQVIIEETPQGIGDDTYRHDRVILDYLGQPFYFDWRYDARGRSYSIGWDINLQSDEYHKAMLSLANEELVTDEHALKIAIAGHAGQDKLSWGDRVAWFDDQEVFDTEYWPEPILGRKALRAYQECLDGIPSGYMMGIDATASGLQIMAVLSDCKETAVRVNLTGDDHRHDVYTHVANSMNNILNKRKVTRTDIKKPLMTMFYNSEAVPKQVLTKRQYKAFIESSKDLLPGPMAVMQLVNECFNPEAKQHKWVLPDGHVAVVDSSKTVQYNVVDEDYGKFHVHFKENRANKDQHRALAPNVIHSIDGWIAREMVRRTDFELVHIHDSFWFHPNNLNQVKQVYREILVDLNKMDLLRSIVKQLTGTDPGKLSKGKLAKHIKASSYALS